MHKLIAVFIGCGPGSIIRYGISRLIEAGELNIKPLATFLFKHNSYGIAGFYLVGRSAKIPDFRTVSGIFNHWLLRWVQYFFNIQF